MLAESEYNPIIVLKYSRLYENLVVILETLQFRTSISSIRGGGGSSPKTRIRPCVQKKTIQKEGGEGGLAALGDNELSLPKLALSHSGRRITVART